MSIRLRELIRNVRQCKTAAEERTVIAKESAALRNAFQEQDTTYRHRNVAKLMYIHMLGYPTHFGQMETLKLIAASGFPEKRMGYLGLMILLDERQEVLMLVTNSLKNDLNSKQQYTVGLALCALGNICSAEMARDLSPELERLLQSSNSYVRKKAALCCMRVIRKVPDAVEAFQEAAAKLLADRHHGVLLAGVALMLEMCEVEPAAVEAYRRHVPTLAKVLRSLLMSGFAPEHDVSGITDPFLQVKVLRLLRVLGTGSAAASDGMSDILAQVATNTEGARNAGNAILYECVQTIMGTESIGGLRVLAINILGRFLGNRDNNMRYVALNILARVVAVDLPAVQRHRSTVVDCVKDADVSIRRRALDLVYALVNEGNIIGLTKELLDYLAVADPEFRPDLTAKIAALVQRFAPDKRWHFDSLLQVMMQAGGDVKEEVWRACIVLLTNAPELHAYAARRLYAALRDSLPSAQLSLVATATWYIGEYGEMLAGGSQQLLPDEPSVSASSAEVVDVLEGVLNRPGCPQQCRDFALTALMKLSVRFADQAERIKALLAAHRVDAALESQARAVEYAQMFGCGADLRAQLLERMPPLDAAAYARSAAAAGTLPAAPAVAHANGNVVKDLLSLDDDEPPNQASAPAPQQHSFADDLLGLSAPGQAHPGGGHAAPSQQAPGGSGGNAFDLLSLLDDPAPAQAPPASTSGAGLMQQDPLDLLGVAGPGPPAAAAASSSGAPDPLAALGFGAAAQPPQQQGTPPQHAPVTVFDKDGVSVRFAFVKPPGRPDAVDINATYSNAGPSPVTGFTLQAAVPKFMQLRLDPASSTTLPAGGAGSARQALHVVNSMHGQRALVMRLRIAYTLDGAQRLEQAEMKDSMVLASEHGGHMVHDKGIDGIGHDGDIIHRLLAGPMEPKVLDATNKKGPARAFLVQLAHSPETRKVLGEHLRNLRNVDGGDRQVTMFLKEEGFHTTIRAVHQALTEAKANDLLFWASRYHLFVLWSVNGTHPWDKLPGAERACATLEIGKLRNSDGEAVVLLDGQPVTDFVFANGILKTTAPLAWAAPSGEAASVHLHLQFSAFAGYGEGASLSSYLGVQAHGILWAAPGSATPAIWPFTPPIVSAKVNVATRDAALAPGGIDLMSFFEGEYELQPLSTKTPMAPLSIRISSQNGRPVVALNGQELAGWTFDYNNVLAWADQAGSYSAWLQALVLPGGPVFVGKVTTGDAYEAVDVMGERGGQASQIAPDAQLDNFVGQQVAAGLATASIVVLGHLMQSALELWAASKGDGRRSSSASKRAAAADAAAEAHAELLDKIGAVNEATEDVFAYGSDVRVLDPAAGKGAEAAQQEAAEAAQSAKTARNGAAENLEGVRAAVAAEDVLDAAHKASVAACRAHSAGKSALVAEESAVAAADLARAARTQAALYAAMTAAQSYHQAKECAVSAVRAAAEAAELAMNAVEAAVAHYVEARDYARLKDMAEASSFAGQALKASEDAEDRWVADSAESRKEALQCAQAASDFAGQTYKHLRLVHNA